MKYGTFKYGDGTKYGTQTANLRWGLAIAWDGQYGWGDDAEKLVSLTVRRGRRNLIAGGGKGLQAFPPGEATVVLDNEDGRYDPFNTSSPLYGYIGPGKFARLKVADIDAGGSYEIMRGVVKDIQPVLQGGKQRVRITMIDGLQWLKDRMINTSLSENKVKSWPPGVVLTRADWPSDNLEWSSAITAVTDVQSYWWSWGKNAYDILGEWSDSIAAAWFHSRDGDLKWRPRTYEYLRNTIIHQEEILEDIGRPQPWEVVRNIVRATVQTKLVDPDGAGPYVLWEMSDVLLIEDGETVYIESLFRYRDWSPAGTNLTYNLQVNTQADGGGADITAQCDYRSSTISEGILRWVTNNSGGNGYIIVFRSTGDPIYAPYVEVREASDAASKALYGPRTLSIGSPWIEGSSAAQGMIDWLLSELKDPGVYPIIQIENRSAKQFIPDLYDSVVLHADKIGISHEQFRVGAIEHQTIGESCQRVRTTFYLEPYMRDGDPEDYFGCRVYAYGDITIGTGVPTALSWSAETHDTDALHSTVSNTSRITIPAGGDGYYKIYAQVKWEDNSAAGYREIRILKNGATYLSYSRHDAAPVTNNLYQRIGDTHYLEAGDYLRVVVYQNSGGNTKVENGSDGIYSFFGVDRIGD